MADGGNRPKFSYLKKGAGQSRIIQRNVIMNPPPPPRTTTNLSSSPSDKTSSHSLPLIDHLSPIPHEPPTNLRPITAETNDSGIRDVNLHVSPTDDSGSIRTTVTTYHRVSPTKAPDAEVDFNQTKETDQLSEGGKCLKKLERIAPTSARIPDISDASSSHAESFTSLDRIKTPPIGTQTRPSGSDKSSDFSAHIDAPSRSNDYASVGTIHDKNNVSPSYSSAAYGNSNESLRPPLEHSNSHLYDRSHPNRSEPHRYSQNYDQETPLNSRFRHPLTKSYSSSDLPYSQQRRSYLGQYARKFGIFAVPDYVLPARPKVLPSPEIPQEFETPRTYSNKKISFFQTPLLPPNFVQKEEGKVVESLAEQLRAALLLIDVGADERERRFNQLKYIYAEKANALKMKEQEMKAKNDAEEKKLISAKAKLKLESDKMKEAEGKSNNLAKDFQEVKTKYMTTASALSETRNAKKQVEDKLKKSEEELQKQKEKVVKWEALIGKLKKEVDSERIKNEQLVKKIADAQPQPPQNRQPLQPQNRQSSQPPPQSRLPLRPSPPLRQPLRPTQLPNQSGYASTSKSPAETLAPKQPPPRKYTNTSSSSVESATKNVRWSSPIAEHREISVASNESFNFSSLRIYIPEELEMIHEIDNPCFVEEQYLHFGNYRIMKDCGCESIRYDNGDLQYCCLTDVNVNICYFEENGQLTVTLPGGFVVNSFQSQQLEILRDATNEKSIVIPDGIRYEFYNHPNQENQTRDKIFNKDEGQRRRPDGTEEILIEPTTTRGEDDYVEQFDDHIVFYCPGFTVTRSLDKDLGGGVTIRVFTDDPNKTWKLTICPEHKVFYIKHHNGNHHDRCTYSEHRCTHLKH